MSDAPIVPAPDRERIRDIVQMVGGQHVDGIVAVLVTDTGMETGLAMLGRAQALARNILDVAVPKATA